MRYLKHFRSPTQLLGRNSSALSRKIVIMEYIKRKEASELHQQHFSQYPMELSYKKLWHLLIDRSMTKSDLQKAARLSWGTISRMNRGENIGTDVLLRICKTLNCDISDIMEITKELKEY